MKTDLNEHFRKHRKPGASYDIIPRIVCADGFDISVQVGDGSYCSPRDGHGPWSQVECGYPSERPAPLMPYCEDPDSPTSTVYGYVPIGIVEDLIDSHGGIKHA